VLHGSLDGLRLTILLEGVLRCDDGRCLAVDVLHDLATHSLNLGLQGLFVHFAILKIDTVLIKWIFWGKLVSYFAATFPVNITAPIVINSLNGRWAKPQL